MRVAVPVRFQVEDDERTGRIENVCADGAFVLAYPPPPPGTPILLRVHLPAARESISVEADVTWTRGSSASASAGFGCSFRSAGRALPRLRAWLAWVQEASLEQGE